MRGTLSLGKEGVAVVFFWYRVNVTARAIFPLAGSDKFKTSLLDRTGTVFPHALPLPRSLSLSKHATPTRRELLQLRAELAQRQQRVLVPEAGQHIHPYSSFLLRPAALSGVVGVFWGLSLFPPTPLLARVGVIVRAGTVFSVLDVCAPCRDVCVCVCVCFIPRFRCSSSVQRRDVCVSFRLKSEGVSARLLLSFMCGFSSNRDLSDPS